MVFEDWHIRRNCRLVHAAFLLLLGWIGLSHWMQYQSLLPTLLGVGFILALFLCVVLHEYGHALAARRFGIATKGITLLPTGGVARLERMPDKPNQELWVALAGPAVNVLIGAVLAAYLFMTGHFQPVQQMGVTHGSFLERVIFANLFLVGFNMIPVFPHGRRSGSQGAHGEADGIRQGHADRNQCRPEGSTEHFHTSKAQPSRPSKARLVCFRNS